MNTIIRILHVLTTMNQGGAETMVMNYYRHIDRNKLQFDFLLHREEIGVYENEIESLGGKIYRLPALTLRTAWSYRKWIYAFLKSHPEYECIHIHSSGVAYFVAKAAHKLGRKIIIQHSHCCSPSGFDFFYPVRLLCKKHIKKYLTHYFSCGKEAAEWQFGKNAKEAIILPNAVDSRKFCYNSEKHEKLKKQFGWEGKYIIGNVARFCPPKNHFQLLEIFKSTLSIKPNAHLVLVGKKDGYYEELVQRASEMELLEHVEFTGARADIPDLLQAFDIFLFPSLFEGLSVAMIEAQAAGLKIIASDNIAKEVAICPELVEFISLAAPLSEWSKALTTYYPRKNTCNEICTSGYDIHENSMILQNFYIKHV